MFLYMWYRWRMRLFVCFRWRCGVDYLFMLLSPWHALLALHCKSDEALIHHSPVTCEFICLSNRVIDCIAFVKTECRKQHPFDGEDIHSWKSVTKWCNLILCYISLKDVIREGSLDTSVAVWAFFGGCAVYKKPSLEVQCCAYLPFVSAYVSAVIIVWACFAWIVNKELGVARFACRVRFLDLRYEVACVDGISPCGHRHALVAARRAPRAVGPTCPLRRIYAGIMRKLYIYINKIYAFNVWYNL